MSATFSPMMSNSVSSTPLDPSALGGLTRGGIDAFDYVDGFQGAVPHPRATRVPRGAPVIVGGWALEPEGSAAPRAVIVVVDGARSYVTVASDRSDIALASGGELPSSIGFRAVIPTDELAVGAHDVRAFVAGSDRRWYQAAYQPFWLYESPRSGLPQHERGVRIRLEPVTALAPNGTIAGVASPVPKGHFALVSGIAIDPRTGCAPSGVAAYDVNDGRWAAPCDMMRPDVRAVLNARDDRLGFEIPIATDALERGRHRLRLAAYDEDGRAFASTAELTFDVAGALRSFPVFARRTSRVAQAEILVYASGNNKQVVVTSDRKFEIQLQRGNVFHIEGWSLSSDGTATEEAYVELRLPGLHIPAQRHATTAGYRRDDAPEALPQSPVEDAWFHWSIDSGHLPPAKYDVALIVVQPDRLHVASRPLGSLEIVTFS